MARIGLAEADISLPLRMSLASLPHSMSFLVSSACRLILSCIETAILLVEKLLGEEWRKVSGLTLIRDRRRFSCMSNEI